MSTTITRNRRRSRKIVAAATAALLVAASVTTGVWLRVGQTSDTSGTSATSDTSEAGRLEARMQSLVEAGYPAVLASVTEPGGDRLDLTAGTGDIAAGEKPPVDGQVRVASNTKMFVATVVMQLVEEGTIELDAPIGTYLPGLIVGDGVDGTRITVHQLLQQTTGLPEYADQIAADVFGAQHRYVSPRDMLDIALTQPAGFAPGEQWEYSNTNYLVLGLMVEAMTDRAIGQQIDERILSPLGLEHTYFPAPGEWELRGEHPRGYHADATGELQEITDLDTSFAWSAGALVSTPSELNTFMIKLLNGDLVSAESLAVMQASVPAGDELRPEAAYGLGLQSHRLSCGGIAWGHGGDVPGTQTRNAVGPDGTAVTIAVTALPWAIVPFEDERLLEQYRIVLDVLDDTLCDT